ncbi:MAG: AAA family ATPase [Leptolyngbyaceae cyanobacterium]
MNTRDRTFPLLPGYTVVEQLSQGARTEVYRALQRDQQSVVIKVLHPEPADIQELVQFRNQYALARCLQHPHIVHPLALERHGASYVLVMPDEGLVALNTYRAQHPWGVAEVLDVALQLTDALHYLIQQRVIHKDIKPSNILIHPESGRVQLIDFSIASLLPRERQQLASPTVLEGTLAYLSPEQTGRMNRGIDYRTDFYALGATLFELLTGEPPFDRQDPMELVHCHLARPVTFPAASPSPIPEAVQAIILKLLAKNAEDRYQSALGLQHDLQLCQQQVQTTGDVAAFELAQQDVGDRFLIPEKLYGRQPEVNQLLAAFERVIQARSELMLVTGFSGVGKTAIINEVHKPITRQKGYFIQGKFDQFNRNVPFSAFVQAFRSLLGQLLGESDTALQAWRAKILDAVGDRGQVIVEVIPELAAIIGPQPPVPELSGSAAQNRFNGLFGQFVRVFTTKAHPLVIFLDDLQWADAASLTLLKLLMAELDTGYLLVLGAYRDNEVFPAHPLMLALDDIIGRGGVVNRLTLMPLAQADITSLVADTLLCSAEMAAPLAQLVYQKTQGNPFFTTRFLQGLYEEGRLVFDSEVGHWQCDLASVRQLALTDNVVEFMVGRLQKLPPTTQAVLMLAACVGNRFDLQTIAIVRGCAPEEIATTLWPALQDNLIMPESETYKFFQQGEPGEIRNYNVTVSYRFAHDRIQQAAYNLIPAEQQQAIHLQIGRMLLGDTPDQQANLFEVVNHWNLSRALLRPDEQPQLAHLNWLAGRKARATAAYESALAYFQVGLSLLASDAWQTTYQLALDLHAGAVKTAFVCGDYAQMAAWSAIALRQSRTVLDQVKFYDVQIQAQMAQGMPAVAIDIALTALTLLGIPLPESPTPADLQAELRNTKALWAERAVAELIHLPLMTKREKVAAMILLSSIFAPSFIAKPEILPFIACQQIQLSIQFGNCAQSAFGYANYSAILNSVSQDLGASYEFGQLAIQLVEKLEAEDVKARTFNQAAIFSMHGKISLRAAPPVLREGCQSGIDQGDLEFAGYAAYNWSQYSYFSGLNLVELRQGADAYGLLLEQLNQKISLACNQLVHQVALNLLEPSPDPCLLQGRVFDEQQVLARFIDNQVLSGVQYLSLHKIVLHCLFARYDDIVALIDWSEQYLSASTGMISVPVFHFFATLGRLQVYAQQPPDAASPLFHKIQHGLAELRRWASQAPSNFQHKLDLLLAEQHRVQGDRYAAADYYDRAIAGAEANGYGQEAALANELAAEFYLRAHRRPLATVYLQAAYEHYDQWGAQAKTADLEQRYPELLRSRLSSPSSRSPVTAPLAVSTDTTLTAQTPPRAIGLADPADINSTFDFATVLKASQTLSGTIHLEELLHQFTQIILQSSGGDRCALILPSSEGDWQVKVVATTEQIELRSDPLEAHPQLPLSLIRYVKNRDERVVVNDLQTALPIVDDYLRQHHPKSVLCLPIQHQGQQIGLLYLSNQHTSEVFTEERLTVLNLLCAQAAISLENARLYEQSQRYARQLQQSQIRIVQNEKMATLGNLVAGIAHEINNPIGFLNGSLTNAKDYAQDLLKHIQRYEQQYPQAVDSIQDSADEIDLAFLREDLPQLLESMQGAIDRIKGISTSLRTFSRGDAEHKVKINLHEGIDSTLLILKYRLKANHNRPAILITKNYGEIPDVECFPGQINQVFLNILANAIDVFDEAAQHTSFDALEASPQQIIVETRTALEYNCVEIRIRDNGRGMDAATQAKIFDHLFTTKPIGKGTGLGLSISYQIVTEQHGGTFSCQSELGRGTEFAIVLPIS